jgi:hypothetical protein
VAQRAEPALARSGLAAPFQHRQTAAHVQPVPGHLLHQQLLDVGVRDGTAASGGGLIGDRPLDGVFAGALEDEKAVVIETGHVFHIVCAALALLDEIDVHGAGGREPGLLKERPSAGDGVDAQGIEIEEVGGDEDGAEPGYDALRSVLLRRDKRVGEGGEVEDVGGGDGVDVAEEGVKRGRRLGEIDVRDVVRGGVGLGEREHVAEDGGGDGEDASVDAELVGIDGSEDEIRVLGVEGVGHPQLRREVAAVQLITRNRLFNQDFPVIDRPQRLQTPARAERERRNEPTWESPFSAVFAHSQVARPEGLSSGIHSSSGIK